MADWKADLQKTLAEIRARQGSCRIAVVGVGNELNGDDGIGPLIAERLRPALLGRPHILLLNAGLAPENFIGPLVDFHPQAVLMIDAAHIQAAPGTIALANGYETDGMSASTHTLPPSVLSGYLSEEAECPILLLAVQAEQLEFDSPLSPSAAQAAAEIIAALPEILG